MIKYTRHSKRRLKLYNISESEVELVIKFGTKVEVEGNKYESMYHFDDKILPLKVVYKVIGNDYIIITSYPLKRGKET